MVCNGKIKSAPGVESMPVGAREGFAEERKNGSSQSTTGH